MDKFALTDNAKKVAPQLAASYKFQREGDQCTTVSILLAGICEDFTLGRGYILLLFCGRDKFETGLLRHALA